jgi:hypothetical protein
MVRMKFGKVETVSSQERKQNRQQKRKEKKIPTMKAEGRFRKSAENNLF